VIFVDTGAWFAAAVENDPDHEAASTGVRPGNLDNLFLRPANTQAKTPSGNFLQS